MAAASVFRLRAELRGHDGAVRAICALENDVVLTGAMDATAKSWLPSADGGYESLESATLYDHEHWVTAAVRLPGGGFATGAMDKKIRLFAADSTRVAELAGHDGGVISLALSACGTFLLSGSWDGSARVWDLRSRACVHVLAGHENGVCVLGLPNGVIVTGSTGRQVGNAVVDFQLRFWTDFALTKTVADHRGPIRQLVLVPELGGFVSCSNDGSIKVRTLDGDVVASMEHPLNAEGKPGFVLGVAVLPNGCIVSASEDCTARVWTADGTLLQTIEHPSGLWCVASLGATGDFVTGCDDKVARIFTIDDAKVAPVAVAAFEDAVREARLVRERGPSGVEIDKLPAYERRGQVTGKSDGQIQMFKKGSKAWACQWSAPSKTWLDIGEVTGTGGGGGVVDGTAYDMVIPVEIELPGGVKKLEIGYNQGENPFMVAQQFIDKHMLDQGYLREIADYITQRSSDYRPPVLGNNEAVDIEMEGSNAPSATNAAAAAPAFKYFPAGGYNTFEATKIGKLMSTLRQYNDKLQSSEADTSTVALSDPDLIGLEHIASVVQETAFYHSSTFTAAEIRVLKSLVLQWPADVVFPALDLLRLVLVHPQGPATLGDATLGELVERMLALGLQTTTAAGADVPVATRMLALRVLANMFLHESGRKSVLAKLQEFVVFRQKTVTLSLATVLLNFSRLHIEDPRALTQDDVVTVGSVAAALLTGALSVEELGDDTVLRALATIGTLALGAYPESKQLLAVHLDIFLGGNGASVASPAVKECLEELQRVLSSGSESVDV
ncbi:hypothetical protein PybrP1_007215 [[Pythium] brassicae (nom. inval.)]|nr:hypothetical protein PybrP1_007215 [[Pythium] brassicae (nom. inval.)]